MSEDDRVIFPESWRDVDHCVLNGTNESRVQEFSVFFDQRFPTKNEQSHATMQNVSRFLLKIKNQKFVFLSLTRNVL